MASPTEIWPSAIVGKRRNRAQHREPAVVGAKIAFQTPKRHKHRCGNPVLLLNAIEQAGIFLDPPLPLDDPIARRHSVGKLQEALLEYALTVIAPHNLRIERQTIER